MHEPKQEKEEEQEIEKKKIIIVIKNENYFTSACAVFNSSVKRSVWFLFSIVIRLKA